MTKKDPTRDDWLARAVTALRPLFAAAGHPIGAQLIRVSVGFPSKRAMAGKCQRIGECWDRADDDGVPQLYISPVLDEPVRVLDVLLHELVHAAVGNKAGHKGPFRKAAIALGLTGKMTATVAGDALALTLTAMAKTLGPFPHAALDPSQGRPKQSTRMLKAECLTDAYIVRLSRKMIEEHGCPVCPTCQEQMTEA